MTMNWFQKKPIAKRWFIFLVLMSGLGLNTSAQSGSTGALAGEITDTTGAMIPDVSVVVRNEVTGAVRRVTSGQDGRFTAPLLPPSTFTVSASKVGFKTVVSSGVIVKVTETTFLPLQLAVGSTTETLDVNATTPSMETQSSALGDVIGSRSITSIPLVTRNFAELLGLSPTVQAPLTNANAVGRGAASGEGGSGSTANGAKDVHGDRSNDNNFQINGLQTNDEYAVGSVNNIDQSGGFAVPNPDTVAEFKVQTGQYDATYGRNAGAQVNLVTKGGQNDFHGTVFEFFRNEDLDANDYFRNHSNKPRGLLRQNQPGFAAGGPIEKNKLLFFASYQYTNQINGVAAQCSAFISSAPAALTDSNRTALGLGQAFAGQRGSQDPGTGLAIAADGSNINPAAVAVLQAKLPNGQYIVPSPQVVVQTSNGPVGQLSFSEPCTFIENQFMTNLDYTMSSKQTLSARFFWVNSTADNTMNSADVPEIGAQYALQKYRVGSISHTYVLSPTLVNLLTGGVYTTVNNLPANPVISYASLGVSAPRGSNGMINISTGIGSSGIIGATASSNSYNLVSGGPADNAQLGWEIRDSLSWVKHAHTLQFGFDGIRQHVNNVKTQTVSVGFLSFPDFLLGRAAGPIASGDNGTSYSNVNSAGANFNDARHAVRNWDLSGYVQDDWMATKSLTINAGFRYEYIGNIEDDLGHLTDLNLAAVPTNPQGLSTDGYILPSNYDRAIGTLPAGVTVANRKTVFSGEGTSTLDPRLGFALQEKKSMVTRGGFGIYYVQPGVLPPTTAANISPPFALTLSEGASSGANSSTLQNPFPDWSQNPSIANVPQYRSYGLNANGTYTNVVVDLADPNYRPAPLELWSLEQAVRLPKDLVLTVGYVGDHALHLTQGVFYDSARFASVTNPVNGQTNNTLANLRARQFYPGLSQSGEMAWSNGTNKYNGLQVTLNKRFTHALEFLASYTFSKDLDTAGTYSGAMTGLSAPGGDPTNPRSSYGLSDSSRPQVFVANYTYDLPIWHGDALLKTIFVNGWTIAGVTAVQSGTPLSITASNSANAYGVSTNYVPLSGPCGRNVETSGSEESRLNNYFNTSCFALNSKGQGVFPVVDPSGTTGYGNPSGIGIARGPDQNSTDLALIKRTHIGFLREGSNLEFRSEFVNAFNHPNFSNPTTTVGTGFGTITSLSVNARIIQFALKLNF